MLDVLGPMKTVGQVIREARKKRSLVLREVAETLGVTTQAVSNWEAGRNELTMENLRAVADLLGIDAEAANRGQLKLVDRSSPENEVVEIGRGPPKSGPRDVELIGVSVGGDDGDFTFNGQVIAYLPRPPGITTLRNVFAVQVIGDSMVPRFAPGEIVYAGGKQPVPGDYVIIEMFPEEGRAAGKGYIKRLVRRTAATIYCEQFNPARSDLEYDAYAVKAMTRVIPWSELLGF